MISLKRKKKRKILKRKNLVPKKENLSIENAGKNEKRTDSIADQSQNENDQSEVKKDGQNSKKENLSNENADNKADQSQNENDQSEEKKDDKNSKKENLSNENAVNKEKKTDNKADQSQNENDQSEDNDEDIEEANYESEEECENESEGENEEDEETDNKKMDIDEEDEGYLPEEDMREYRAGDNTCIQDLDNIYLPKELRQIIGQRHKKNIIDFPDTVEKRREFIKINYMNGDKYKLERKQLNLIRWKNYLHEDFDESDLELLKNIDPVNYIIEDDKKNEKINEFFLAEARIIKNYKFYFEKLYKNEEFLDKIITEVNVIENFNPDEHIKIKRNKIIKEINTKTDKSENETDKAKNKKGKKNTKTDKSENETDKSKNKKGKKTAKTDKSENENDQSENENDQSNNNNTKEEYLKLSEFIETSFCKDVHRNNVYYTYKLYTSRLFDMILLKTGVRFMYITKKGKKRVEIPMCCIICLTLWAPINFRKHVLRYHNSEFEELPRNMRQTYKKDIKKGESTINIANNNYNNIILEFNKTQKENASKQSLFSSMSDINFGYNTQEYNKTDQLMTSEIDQSSKSIHYKKKKGRDDPAEDERLLALMQKILNDPGKEKIRYDSLFPNKVKSNFDCFTIGGKVYPNYFIDDNVYFRLLFNLKNFLTNTDKIDIVLKEIINRENNNNFEGYKTFIVNCDPKSINEIIENVKHLLEMVLEEKKSFFKEILIRLEKYKNDIMEKLNPKKLEN